MTVAHLDFESYSECDLGDCGLYKYAEDPTTEILCVCYAFDDEEVQLWRPDLDGPCPERLRQHIESGGTVCAHNYMFERVMSNSAAARKIGFPPLGIPQGRCTAVKAASNGIPRSLAEAAKALGTAPKDDNGRFAMLALCKPRKPTKADPATRWTMKNALEKFETLWRYCKDDVRAEREIDQALPDIDPNEQRLYELDQRVNDAGWLVDLESAQNILYVVEQYKEQLAVECEELTRDWLTGTGLKPTQREKIAEWVRANGYPGLLDMTAETIKCAVKLPTIPETAKKVLRIFTAYGAKSVSKLQAMLRVACADGRLRGMLSFYGAATGRWSSQLVQVQNLARPLIKDPNVAIEAFRERSLETIRFLWPDKDPMKVAGSCVRGLLVSSPGMDLVFPDFSGIEDRVNAWFFDEQWVLDAYRDYDAGKGRHLYSITVCRAFGLDLAGFSDEDPRRQWGKVMRLALGYEGGVSAFATMVDTYGIDLEEMAKVVLPLLPVEALEHAKWMRENHPSNTVSGDVETACNGLKFLWRRDHPHIVQGWKHLKEAAERAVEFEGQVFWIPNKKIGFRVETYKGRKWLCMRLPSGRKIKYFDPEWTPPRESERWINNELVPYTIPGFMDYMGVDTYTRQWMRLQTYGGKLDENADQGFSRDLLCNAMLAQDAAGEIIVGSEHDKVILEVPEGGQGPVDRIKQRMIDQPAYAAGLPLATDGKRSKRYGK
jgi:DNA polymerase